MSRFQTVMPRILKSEGGKVDDPRDPGGRTNQGVTQTNFNKWLISQGKGPRDVFGMTNAERDAIYKSLYWDAVGADLLPVGLDYVMMDGAVHSGPSQAVKWLQRSLAPYYTGDIDGKLGPLTRAAIESYPSTGKLINAVLDRRLAFLQALKAYAVFGNGWSRRVKEVRNVALLEANGQEIAHAPLAPSTAKAPVTNAKNVPTNTLPDLVTAGGAGAGGSAFGIDKAQDALAPYAGINDTVQMIFVGLVIAGVVLSVGGVIWRFWNSRKAADLADRLDLSPENRHAVP